MESWIQDVQLARRQAMNAVVWEPSSESTDPGLGAKVQFDAEERPASFLGLPSRGSVTHASGKCVPCHYHDTTAGCLNGRDCSFCHMHRKDSRQRPNKAKRAKAKLQAASLDQHFEDKDQWNKVAEELRGKGGYLASVVQGKAREREMLERDAKRHEEREPPEQSAARGSGEGRPKNIMQL
mmetsp:Transcript_96782/g.282946  ORF Transcript_96782/g.282946 Transcript_96782/m.282946 type:complete len:181 (+) Transcript_96782:62-604(+)